MRVLHVGKYYPPFAGGMEYFLADLLRALSERGLGVAALVHHEARGAPGVRPSPLDNPAIYRAPCHGRLLYAPLSPAFPFWLDRAIRELRPDLLHLHLPNSSALAALLVPPARRLPWVIHWHADLVPSHIDRRLALAYRLYRPLEQKVLARSEAVIVSTTPYLETSEALARWRSRCVTIPLGLDPGRLVDPTAEATQRAETEWRAAGLRLLAIGRLTYYKGHDVLIAAMARVPAAQLLIVGSGEREAHLRTLSARLDIQGRVRLLGFRAEHELAALLASCDLVCLPSIERTEAFGLVLLEAMRFGKPVVVSDIPGSGTGWVVREAGNGLLVPPGDVEALALALGQLAQDPNRRRVLGQRGALALDRVFAIGTVSDAIIDVYKGILGRRGLNLDA